MDDVKIRHHNQNTIGKQMNYNILLNNHTLRYINNYTCNPTIHNVLLRNLSNLTNYKNLGKVSDSENWLSRSLEIAYVFLHHDIPVVGQVISVHK